MNKSDFLNLVEYQNLNCDIEIFLEKINKHNIRVNSLIEKEENNKNDHSEITETHKKTSLDLKKLEADLFSSEEQRSKCNQNIEVAKNEQQISAIENELKSVQLRISELENSILEKMEEVDAEQLQIKEIQDFLNGIKSTIVEIQTEVNSDIENENKQIKQIKVRLVQLNTEIDPTLLRSYNNVLESSKLPLAFAIDSKCTSCKSMINANQFSQIQKVNSIEQCESCGRILTLPSQKLLS
jgi:predicted  nucleic acid-binding Zn-ribbon protein